MTFKIISAAFAALAIFACQSEKKCKYKPEPIFSKDLPTVLQYNFEVQGSESLESVFFQNHVLLEIHQTVCDKTKQEYKFTVRGNYSTFPDSNWMREASSQLRALSILSPKQLPLAQWSDILDENRPNMKLGEPAEVQPGIFAKIDKVAGPEQSVLLLEFEQR